MLLQVGHGARPCIDGQRFHGIHNLSVRLMCTEGVTWYVMKTPVEVSPDQIAIFGRIYPNN